MNLIKTITFDCKISTNQIEFLDIVIYKDQQRKIQTTILRKSTDQQIYIHVLSNYPKSLKSIILYSQALGIKTMCSTTSKFSKIIKRFIHY